MENNTMKSFNTLSDYQLCEVNGGSLTVAIIVGGGLIISGAFGLGVYNGYQDTKHSVKRKKRK